MWRQVKNSKEEGAPRIFIARAEFGPNKKSFQDVSAQQW